MKNLLAIIFLLISLPALAQQNVVPISQMQNGGVLQPTDSFHISRCNSAGCDYRVNTVGTLASAIAPLSYTLGGTGLQTIGAANTCLTSNGTTLSYQPCSAGGSGSVTNFSFLNGSGATGSVTNPTTTPLLAISPTAGGTFASSSNNLGFFSSTTSAQLGSVISDKTGTGTLVFSSAPTLTGITNASAITLSGNLTTNVTGSTECLHVNSSGLVSGTGSDCAAGGLTSFSAGTTGLTPSSPSTGAVVLGGVLSVANGGTGNGAFTQGSVVFASTGGILSQNNANFFWDNSNHRLGIGTSIPSFPLSVVGNTQITGSALVGNLNVSSSGIPALGLYAPGSNILGFSTNSTQAMVINASQEVGIGTSSPNELLDVWGTLDVDSNSTNAFTVGQNGNANPAFQINASNASSVTGWAIVTTAAGVSSRLNVISSATNENGFLVAKGNGFIMARNSYAGSDDAAPQFVIHNFDGTANDSVVQSFWHNGVNIAFFEALSEGTNTQTSHINIKTGNAGTFTSGISIDHNAQVGIGTSIPVGSSTFGALFNVGSTGQFTVTTAGNASVGVDSGTVAGLAIGGGTNLSNLIELSGYRAIFGYDQSNLVLNGGGNKGISMYVNGGGALDTGTLAMTIGTTGFVGIGTTSPAALLDVYSSVGAGSIDIGGVNGLSFPLDTTPGASIAIGSSALVKQSSLTSENYGNTAIGYQSMASASLGTTGINNTAVGYLAGTAITTGNGNTLVGYEAGMGITTTQNTAMGYQALATGNSNASTAIGYRALSFGSVSGATAVGNNALTVTTGGGNSAFGNGAGGFILSGTDNTAMGSGAMSGNATVANRLAGSNNSAFGFNSLNAVETISTLSASNNTAFGFETGQLVTTGSNNTIIGNGVASTTLTTGTGNILIGTQSGVDTQSSSSNNTMNIGNLIYGTGLGTSGTTPIGSVGIGTATPLAPLDIRTSGATGNVQIGSLPTSNTLGAIFLNGQFSSSSYNFASSSGGNLLINRQSGENILFREGNSDEVSFVSGGSVGIGTTTPRNSALLDVNGGLNVSGSGVFFTGLTTGTNADFLCAGSTGQAFVQTSACTISQRKLKENFLAVTGEAAVDDIMALKPMQFNFKKTNPANPDINATRTQYGFIAEDVALVDPKLSIYEADGVTPKSWRQESVIAELVKVSQVQQEEINHIREGRDGYRCYGVFWCKEK